MQVYKQLIIVIFYLSQVGCNSNSRNKAILNESHPLLSTRASCDTIKVDSLFKIYAEAFMPTKLGLDKCLPDAFDTLLNKIDSNCLRSLPHYKYSILLVLLKLYNYDIRVGHQGYDLLTMKEGASKIIINEFELIGGYKSERLEMLNSGTVLDVIDKEKELKSNPTLKKYYEEVKQSIKKQEKMGY
jgi:hypothetical protein